MKETQVCSSDGCSEVAIYRYTWPGRPEAFACLKHAVQLKRVSDAMGFYLQCTPIEMGPVQDAPAEVEGK